MAEVKYVGLKPGEEKVIQEISDQMFDGTQKIIAVTHMPGGLTNRNFKVEYDNGQKYAFRIAGYGCARRFSCRARK